MTTTARAAAKKSAAVKVPTTTMTAHTRWERKAIAQLRRLSLAGLVLRYLMAKDRDETGERSPFWPLILQEMHRRSH